MGSDEDDVLNCKDHLLNLAEEYEQEVQDNDRYMKTAPKPQEKKTNSGGFQVANAP